MLFRYISLNYHKNQGNSSSPRAASILGSPVIYGRQVVWWFLLHIMTKSGLEISKAAVFDPSSFVPPSSILLRECCRIGSLPPPPPPPPPLPALLAHRLRRRLRLRRRRRRRRRRRCHLRWGRRCLRPSAAATSSSADAAAAASPRSVVIFVTTTIITIATTVSIQSETPSRARATT